MKNQDYEKPRRHLKRALSSRVGASLLVPHHSSSDRVEPLGKGHCTSELGLGLPELAKGKTQQESEIINGDSNVDDATCPTRPSPLVSWAATGSSLLVTFRPKMFFPGK